MTRTKRATKLLEHSMESKNRAAFRNRLEPSVGKILFFYGLGPSGLPDLVTRTTMNCKKLVRITNHLFGVSLYRLSV